MDLERRCGNFLLRPHKYGPPRAYLGWEPPCGLEALKMGVTFMSRRSPSPQQSVGV